MENLADRIPLTVEGLEKLGFREFDIGQWQYPGIVSPEVYVVDQIHGESGLDTFQLFTFDEADELVPRSEIVPRQFY